MGVGNDVAFGYCIYDWRSGITVMKGSSGGTTILQLTPTLTGLKSSLSPETQNRKLYIQI
jgi:hypothetical protein